MRGKAVKKLAIAACFAAACLLALTADLFWAGGQRSVPQGTVQLAQLIPGRIGAWRESDGNFAAVDPSDIGEENGAASSYDQIVSRSYRHPDGTEVILTLAYGRVQEQETKIHRPEHCYSAQGFELVGDRSITLNQGRSPGRTFVAMRPERSEVVAYWVRIGDAITPSSLGIRLALLRLGVGHIMPDGILVRGSIVSPGVPNSSEAGVAAARLAGFLDEVVRAVPASQRWILVGGPPAVAAAV